MENKKTNLLDDDEFFEVNHNKGPSLPFQENPAMKSEADFPSNV